MAKVTMPQLGESVAEGTIGKWLKQPGDHVDKYEPLLEVITDKVNAEVPSPFEGTLREILAEEGATVPNNAEIAIIETADDGAADAAASAGTGAVVTSTPAGQRSCRLRRIEPGDRAIEWFVRDPWRLRPGPMLPRAAAAAAIGRAVRVRSGRRTPSASTTHRRLSSLPRSRQRRRRRRPTPTRG